MFNNLFGVRSIYIGDLNEIWEVKRVTNQKPLFAGQIRVINAILNWDTSLLASNPYWSFHIFQMCLSDQLIVIYAISSLVAPILALNPYNLS